MTSVVATTTIVGESIGMMIAPEDLPLVRAVDAGRLQDLGGDALEAGRQHDHREAGPHPDPDEDQGRSC